MDIHKICRVCLEEGALTSIYSTEFAMMPCVMMMICAKIRVYKTDGLPAVICNNCIYRLGVAYHFKQECENSDIRLRQYLGLPDRSYGFCDAETNTELNTGSLDSKTSNIFLDPGDNSAEEDDQIINISKKSKRSRYKRKPPEEHKKRGPKPLPKLPHTCFECNKSFKCQAQLQMHARTHTGEKPYACHYCPRRFAQKYNLQIHERIHSGERPYQCEICSKQFSALGNFQAHQKIHTGVRDQICPVCQKAFYSVGDLTKHMVTHTGLKNHHCNVCGKAFSRQRDMQTHKRKLHTQVQEEHTEDDDEDEAVDADDPQVVVAGTTNAYKCTDCEKKFSTASSLSVHYRTHGSSNLLNFPPMTQLPPPLPSHPHAPQPHHYHTHAHTSLLPPPPPPSGPTHEHLHNLHAPHHLPLSGVGPPPPPAGMQTNYSSTSITPSIAHASMAHMLPPPPFPATQVHPTHATPPPTAALMAQSTLNMMHVSGDSTTYELKRLQHPH